MAVIGTITKPGDVVNFTYSGDIQTFDVPLDGIYKFELYGGAGGKAGNASGGKGGYTVGYRLCQKGDILYIVTGGKGATNFSSAIPERNPPAAGGYNGGGIGASRCRMEDFDDDGNWNGMETKGGGGGGATHISTISATIDELANNRDAILLVAGGAGGGAVDDTSDRGDYRHYEYTGGAGGGLNGGSASGSSQSPGTQTGPTNSTVGSSGISGGAGSGGGWHGGYRVSSQYGGAGGSGYIDGMPEISVKGVTYTPSTISGVNDGNGYAAVTLVDAGVGDLGVYAGDKPTDVNAGNNQIIDIYAGDAAI